MKRILGPLLLGILVIGILAGIGFAVFQLAEQSNVTTVRGLAGSEKMAFFADETVQEVFRKNHNLILDVEKSGSREMADKLNPGHGDGLHDFGFPAGVPGAEKISTTLGGKEQDIFFTPMAIASWRPIAEILVANGIAQPQGGGAYYTLDMAALLTLTTEGKRWSDLNDNDAYDVNKSVLISSTDLASSNSAAMYLSLAGYVLNNNEIVVDNPAQIAAVVEATTPLFTLQGFQESSSQGPFDNYLTMGMGKAPLVMIYESQFITEAARPENERILQDDMVLMYPEPNIFSQHVLVTFTPEGELMAEALLNDPDLQRLAIEYGFRNKDLAYFRQFTNQHHIELPDNLLNVIEPPKFDVLEQLIDRIIAFLVEPKETSYVFGINPARSVDPCPSGTSCTG